MPGIVIPEADRHRDTHERRMEELERALAALVAVDPILEYHQVLYACHHCEARDAGSWRAVRPEEVEHSATCPWVAARALLAGQGEA